MVYGSSFIAVNSKHPYIWRKYNMKSSLILCVIFFLALAVVNAQSSETIRVSGSQAAAFIEKSQFKFPIFTRGKVHLKDGEVASARINFDYFSNAIKYIDEKGDTVLIDNTGDVQYVSTAVDTFFYDGMYYEWAATSSKARLALRRNLKLAQTEKVGAYGISSPTQNIVTQGLILGATNYQLDANEEYVFLRETSYYISTLNGRFVPANKKNFSKLFPKKDIEQYIKDNKINLNNEKNLMDLFVFANTK